MPDELNYDQKRRAEQVKIIMEGFKGGGIVGADTAWKYVESGAAPADYPADGLPTFELLTNFADYLEQQSDESS